MSFMSSHCRKLVILLDQHYVKTVSILGKKFINNVCSARFMVRPNRNAAKQCSVSAVSALSFVKILEFTGLKEEENHDVKTLIRKANDYLEEGKQKEAEDLYNEALKIASDEQDLEDLFLIKIKLAAVAFFKKKYKEAETLYTEVRDYLIKSGIRPDDLQLLYINLRLAEIYDGLQNYEKAEELYNLCARNANFKNASIDKSDEEFKQFWLMFLSSEAHYYLNRGNFDKAHEYFVKAYDISAKTKGEMTEQTVKLLQQLGSVCYQKGDLETAVTHLKKATELGRHLPGMVELSNAYISLGNIYLKQGLIKDAEAMCRQGNKNAVRHKYEQGIKESEACLKELEEIIEVLSQF